MGSSGQGAARQLGNQRTGITQSPSCGHNLFGAGSAAVVEVTVPRDGVIADYYVTQGMLEYFIDKVTGRFHLRRPIVMISVPYGVTSVERRAVRVGGGSVVRMCNTPCVGGTGAARRDAARNAAQRPDR